MSTLESTPRESVLLPRPLAVGRAERARVLAVVALGPLVIGYVAVAALLAVISAFAPGAAFSTAGVLGATGPVWLAAYHVPVQINGLDIGLLPLLPTILVMLLVGRSAAGAADRLGADAPRDALPVLVATGSGHALLGTLLAMISSHGLVSCSPVLAFFLCAAVAILAATIGVAGRCGLVAAVFQRADPAALLGLRGALLGSVGLLAAAGVALGVALIGSFPAVTAGYRAEAPGLGSGLGMFLLSLAYLPNVLVAVCSFVTGPGLSVGRAVFGPLVFHAGRVPGVPMLAVVPDVSQRWWPVLFVLPAAVGVFVGWFCRRSPERLLVRFRGVLVAGLTVAVGALVVAALSGGALAGGPFDPVTVPAGLFAAACFGWVAVPGVAVVLLPDFRSRVDRHEALADNPAEDDLADFAVTDFAVTDFAAADFVDYEDFAAASFGPSLTEDDLPEGDLSEDDRSEDLDEPADDQLTADPADHFADAGEDSLDHDNNHQGGPDLG